MKNTVQLIKLLIKIFTIIVVSTVALLFLISRKLQIKEKADTAYEWCKDALRRLFEKIAGLFRKSYNQ